MICGDDKENIQNHKTTIAMTSSSTLWTTAFIYCHVSSIPLTLFPQSQPDLSFASSPLPLPSSHHLPTIPLSLTFPFSHSSPSYSNFLPLSVPLFFPTTIYLLPTPLSHLPISLELPYPSTPISIKLPYLSQHPLSPIFSVLLPFHIAPTLHSPFPYLFHFHTFIQALNE